MQTYSLKYPIVQTLKAVGGDAREVTISEVTLRRPKADDLRLLDKQPGRIAQSLALIGALTGLTPLQVGELDGEDVTALAEFVSAFFPNAQATGEMS